MSDERPGLQVTSRDRLSEGAGEGLSSPVHSLSVWSSQAELGTTPADTHAGPVPSCHTHYRQHALVRSHASYIWARCHHVTHSISLNIFSELQLTIMFVYINLF